jgi:HSP20 family protein
MTLVKFNHPGFKANTSFFDQFFGDDFFRPAFQEKRFGGCAMPAVNVSEGPESFRIDVAAPGLDKADFKTSLEKDVLTIKVEKEAAKYENGVLSVSLPKRKEEMEKAAREIEIG